MMSGALDQLLPHRAPMQWIKALMDCTATTATATACFQTDDFAIANGQVLEAALVECVAQTVAAALAQRAINTGKTAAAQGMLVGVTHFKLASPARAGEQLRIEVNELKRLGPMLLVAGKISAADRLIATGELSLYA